MITAPHLVFLFAIFAVSSGYIFDCLNDCECDTSDYIIICPSGHRTQLELPPEGRLRGFSSIGLIDNNVINLPEESMILDKFPDLEVIGVEKNPSFNCSSLESFKKITIISDCEKNLNNTAIGNLTIASDPCGLSCQTSKHYAKVRMYAISLWRTVVEKYEEFDLNDTVTAIANFFSKLWKKINVLEKKDKEEELEKARAPELVTPMTMLKEMNIGEEVEI